MNKQANPFTPATKVRPRVKALLYGNHGAGKSYLALSAPGKVAVIDAEAGTVHYAGRPGLSEFDHMITRSNAEARDAIQFLAANPGMYETVVVDPITILYDGMQEASREKEIRKKRDEDADLTFRSWGAIGRNFKALATALRNLPMNVIVVARESTEYETIKGELVKTGVKPDAHKSTPYDYDTIIRMHVDKKGVRLMTVEKDRSGLLEVGKTYSVPDASDGSPFTSIFGDLGTSGDEAPSVPDPEAAINADAVDLGAPEKEEVAGPEMADALVEALEAIGKDPVEVLASTEYSGLPSWAEVPKAYVGRVLDRARSAASEEAGEEPAPEPSGAEGQSSGSEEDQGGFAEKVNKSSSKGGSRRRKES